MRFFVTILALLLTTLAGRADKGVLVVKKTPLEAGDKFVVVGRYVDSADSYWLMGPHDAMHYRMPPIDVTVTDGEIASVPEEACVVTLEKSRATDTDYIWYFKTDYGYMYVPDQCVDNSIFFSEEPNILNQVKMLINTRGTATALFKGYFRDHPETGSQFCMSEEKHYFYLAGEATQPHNTLIQFYRLTPDGTTSITAPNADEADEIEYFDMLGRPVGENYHGICLRKTGSTVTKVIR